MRTDELLDVMEVPVPDQLAWADRISLGARKVALAEPWASAFSRFGRFERVQALQVEIAQGRYFRPALATARRLGLRTELGLALAFDIHVQNGGIGSAVQREIESRRREIPPTRERELRLIVGHAVAAHARPEFRADVLSRKRALALGAGTVHGSFYEVTNWGLDESEAAEAVILPETLRWLAAP